MLRVLLGDDQEEEGKRRNLLPGEVTRTRLLCKSVWLKHTAPSVSYHKSNSTFMALELLYMILSKWYCLIKATTYMKHLPQEEVLIHLQRESPTPPPPLYFHFLLSHHPVSWGSHTRLSLNTTPTNCKISTILEAEEKIYFCIKKCGININDLWDKKINYWYFHTHTHTYIWQQEKTEIIFKNYRTPVRDFSQNNSRPILRYDVSAISTDPGDFWETHSESKFRWCS